MSGTALVSADVRARPVAQRAAFEAHISTKVLRQDSSRSPVHHEGSAGKAALSVFTAGCPPDLNEGWSRPDRRSNSDGVFDHAMLGVVRFRVTPMTRARAFWSAVQ